MESNKQKDYQQKSIPVWALLCIALIAGFLIELFGASSVSPLYAGNHFGTNDFDPNFFLYLGMAYAKGKTPYVEIFDHKGLYIFWIEGFGYLLGGKNGMYVILSLYMAANMAAFLLVLREIGYGTKSLIFGMLFLAIFYGSFMYGNHSGDLLNPFFSLIYLFYIYGITRKKERYFFLGSLFAGLGAGLSICSRPSEAIVPLAAVIFYFIYWLKHEKNINLLWNALICLAALFIPVGAAIIQAKVGGYFELMWNAVYHQSAVYVSNHNGLFRLASQLGTAVAVCLGLVFAFFARKRLGKDNPISLFLFIVLALSGIVQILIARFPHYWLTYIFPLSLAAFIAIFPVESKEKKFSNRVYAILNGALSFGYVMLAIFSICTYYGFEKPIGLANDGEIMTTYAQSKQAEKDVISLLKDDAEKGEEIYLLDCNSAPLLILDRASNARLICNSSWWSEDNKDMERETIEYLQEEKPKWVITGNHGFSSHNENIYRVINGNYSKQYSNYYLTFYQLGVKLK